MKAAQTKGREELEHSHDLDSKPWVGLLSSTSTEDQLPSCGDHCASLHWLNWGHLLIPRRNFCSFGDLTEFGAGSFSASNYGV